MYINSVLQDKFLDSLAQKQASVVVYFKTGSKLTGKLIRITADCIILKSDVTHTLHRDAITSIVPLGEMLDAFS